MSDTNDANRESLVPEAEEILKQSKGRAPDDAVTGEVEDARREAQEARDQMLRALAEAENVRRRAQRDVSDARQYAVTSFARDLLNVADNFDRALAAMGGTDEDALPAEMKALVDGVRMTERELKSVFERHGIKAIEPVGQKFDPNKHQAMFEVENAEVASGTVVQMVQSGYVIGERVLRPAMVGVSKGGPKAEAQKADDAGAPEAPEAGQAGADEAGEADASAAPRTGDGG